MAEQTKKKESHEDKPLERMTVKELREVAMVIPHTTAIHDMKKDELLAFIREARGIKDEPTAKPAKKVVKLKMTRAQIKAKIREIRAMRLQALEADDRKKAVSLRHRITALKKKSRRVAGT
ncbi:MAG: transcription termination factor Rho [Thermodesulfobacteriota bacterium]